MDVEAFCQVLERHGLARGAGVPCSYFGSLFEVLPDRPGFTYVSAANEGEAVALAAGMMAAGNRAFAVMQNSGLGNAVNPLTSLVVPYAIPLTVFVSHRGQPGFRQEPQHQVMGAITEDLIRLCGLDCRIVEAASFDAALGENLAHGRPTGWVLRRGTIEGSLSALRPPIDVTVWPPSGTAARWHATLTREEALGHLLPLLSGPSAPAVVSTTGMLSRELFELDDRDHVQRNRFYMVGSMGCAAAFGLGVNLGVGRPVLVLDGDGALLMRFGTLATVGASGAANFRHVVFDNGAHATTGGQRTSSPSVDLATVALACGYRRAATVSEPAELVERVVADLDAEGPTFVRVLIRAEQRSDVGRPTLSPSANWARFTGWLAEPVKRSA